MKGDKVVYTVKHFGNLSLFLHRWDYNFRLQNVVVVKSLNRAAFYTGPFNHFIKMTQEWIDDALVMF